MKEKKKELNNVKMFAKDVTNYLESLPYPEELFKDYPKEFQAFVRLNWSGNPDLFIHNCEKALGIRIGEYDEIEKTFKVTRSCK